MMIVLFLFVDCYMISYNLFKLPKAHLRVMFTGKSPGEQRPEKTELDFWSKHHLKPFGECTTNYSKSKIEEEKEKLRISSYQEFVLKVTIINRQKHKY